MTVWHNGILREGGEISISAYDPAFSGMGAFETLLASNGQVFQWRAHAERLENSLALLSIPAPNLSELLRVVAGLLSINNLESGEARVRVAISGSLEQAQNVIVTATPYERPPEMVTLKTSSNTINETSLLRQAKTLSYAENWLFRHEAEALEVDDVIIGNTSGNLAESSMSNVIIRHEGVLKTPPTSSGCLPGVTRKLLFQMAPDLREENIAISSLADAEEIWLCNSLRRLQYATRLDGREFAAPSYEFHDLSEALETLIASGAS